MTGRAELCSPTAPNPAIEWVPREEWMSKPNRYCEKAAASYPPDCAPVYSLLDLEVRALRERWNGTAKRPRFAWTLPVEREGWILVVRPTFMRVEDYWLIDGNPFTVRGPGRSIGGRKMVIGCGSISEFETFTEWFKGRTAPDLGAETLNRVVSDALQRFATSATPFAGLDRCGICGRPLTDAESVKLGIGPDCSGYLGLPHPRHPGVRR